MDVEVVERTEPGFAVLPRRWVVERTFGMWGKHRRLSKDYERLPQISESFVYQAITALMLQRLVPSSFFYRYPLQRRFGIIEQETIVLIEKLSPEDLEHLVEAILEFTRSEDLLNWLQDH